MGKERERGRDSGLGKEGERGGMGRRALREEAIDSSINWRNFEEPRNKRRHCDCVLLRGIRFPYTRTRHWVRKGKREEGKLCFTMAPF